ncbi:MAG: hypothetical protein II603_08415 [Muribaculaceae bacterium]|nr:hypothetical protein [Muribaculaceae bacterium]
MDHNSICLDFSCASTTPIRLRIAPGLSYAATPVAALTTTSLIEPRSASCNSCFEI